MRLRLTCAMVALAVGFAGCGSKEQPIKVNGILTWEDGTPISEAQIEFIPQGDGKPAGGITGKDGRFDLTTTNSGDGAVPGKYKVVVIKRDVQKTVGNTAGPPEDITKAMAKFAAEAKAGKKTSDKAGGPESLLPAVYATAATTPLQWTVEPGGGEVKLTLKKL